MIFLKSLVFSNKSEKFLRDFNVHTFIVDKSLNKFQIKDYIKNFFSKIDKGVTIGKVRSCSTRTKIRDKNKKITFKKNKKVFVEIFFSSEKIKKEITI